MMIFMVLGWGLILLLTLFGGTWVVRELFPHSSQVPAAAGRELSAREILDRRFARGEISREEYAAVKDTLSEAGH